MAPPGDFDRYTVDHYREEVDAVRREIGADTVILYGHSWGGILALEYILSSPQHVSRLVLSGTLHDVADATTVMRQARCEELTEDELAHVRAAEAAGKFDDPEYQRLTEQVYSQRLIRVANPIWREKMELNMDVYGLMWGPTEYALAENARLRGWSVKDRLGEIDAPTLVVVGEHDEIGPEISRDIADRISTARLEVMPDCSHHIFWEKPDAYFEVVDGFLTR